MKAQDKRGDQLRAKRGILQNYKQTALCHSVWNIAFTSRDMKQKARLKYPTHELCNATVNTQAFYNRKYSPPLGLRNLKARLAYFNQYVNVRRVRWDNLDVYGSRNAFNLILFYNYVAAESDWPFHSASHPCDACDDLWDVCRPVASRPNNGLVSVEKYQKNYISREN